MDEHQAALFIGIAAIAIVAVLIMTSTADTDSVLEQFYSSSRSAYGQFFSPSGTGNPQSSSIPKIEEVKLECGSVVSKSVFLSSDIICKDTSKVGVSFETDGITIDCRGHKISGLNKNSYGIYLKNRKHIVIKNCDIENFQYGVYLLGSGNIELENVKAMDNDIGFVLWNSDSNALRSIEASQNRRGIYLQASSKTILAESAINKNKQYGIFSLYSDPLEIINSKLCGNPSYDIYISPKGTDIQGGLDSKNTCDLTHNWKDQVTEGCANKC